MATELILVASIREKKTDEQIGSKRYTVAIQIDGCPNGLKNGCK
jgi:hypothetical protein